MGFGWAEVAYSGVTFPLVEPALEHAAKLGYRRIVVSVFHRYFGSAHFMMQQTPSPGMPSRYFFCEGPHLSDHPLVVDAFVERLGEILTGTGNMNCQMCKYREAVLVLRMKSAYHNRAIIITLKA